MIAWEKSAKEKYGNKFNYEDVIYLGSTHDIKLTCPDHGVITISPASHLKIGCPQCHEPKTRVTFKHRMKKPSFASITFKEDIVLDTEIPIWGVRLTKLKEVRL